MGVMGSKYALKDRVLVRFLELVRGKQVEIVQDMVVTGVVLEVRPGDKYDTIESYNYRVSGSLVSNQSEWVKESQIGPMPEGGA
jgi:hypothetical protein